MRVDILVLFLISEEKLSVFYHLNIILTVIFFVDVLSTKKEFSFQNTFPFDISFV